ncbi:hypothetical protein [Taibaiella soli]|uniref:Uncharacterized protein n=1 Tax=Taibaiella soli TaxID=1649169 RepID=A0A2W2AY71_9BACT|nr:hypothetical protein [Taibaiella soli]PZF72638.1 hypothetical protein DN068_12290 [Taibaiella soli]
MKEKKEVGMPAFTVSVLQNLKAKGYQFIQVEGITSTGYVDHIIGNYIVLTPFYQLPEGPGLIEVYESIESPIIQSWAESGDETIVVKRKFAGAI